MRMHHENGIGIDHEYAERGPTAKRSGSRSGFIIGWGKAAHIEAVRSKVVVPAQRDNRSRPRNKRHASSCASSLPYGRASEDVKALEGVR